MREPLPSILITGGAGFIGTHTARLLNGAGLDVVILITP
jgi:nucleoside-diphosphate-sugar epimerase